MDVICLIAQLVGTSGNEFIHIPSASLPFPPTSSLQQYRVLSKVPLAFGPDEKRFNDAAVDPAGHFLAGTMGREHHQKVGKLHLFDSAGDHNVILDGLTCSNGIGWSADSSRM